MARGGGSPWKVGVTNDYLVNSSRLGFYGLKFIDNGDGLWMNGRGGNSFVKFKDGKYYLNTEIKSSPISSDSCGAVLYRSVKKYYQAESPMKSKLGETNKEDGDAFLAENGKSEGVVTLPSGLQYKVDMTGTGKKPTSGQQCPVRFLQRGDYAKKT